MEYNFASILHFRVMSAVVNIPMTDHFHANGSNNHDVKGIILDIIENGNLKELANILSQMKCDEDFKVGIILSEIFKKWEYSKHKKYKSGFLYLLADIICINRTLDKNHLSEEFARYIGNNDEIINKGDLDLCFLLLYLQNITVEKALTGDEPELDPDMMDALPWLSSEVQPGRSESRVDLVDNFVFRNGLTPIQAACLVGSMDFFESFLEMGCDPNLASDRYEYPSIFIVATFGNFDMFEKLCRHEKVSFEDVLRSEVSEKFLFHDEFDNKKLPLLKIAGPTILHCVLNKSHPNGGYYDKCFNEIFTQSSPSKKSDQIKKIINFKDEKDNGNCPLMLAKCKNWPKGVIKTLMKFGANICNANAKNDMPLDYITDEILLDFLDNDCISKDHQVDLSFFAVPRQLKPNISVANNESSESTWGEFEFSEMETLHQLSRRAKESRSQYLTHPIVRLFLHKKWKRVVSIYNSSIRMHFLFTFCFTWYFLETFGGPDVRQSRVIPGLEEESEKQCWRVNKELREDVNDNG